MRAHVLLAAAAAMLINLGLAGCGSKCGPDNCSGCCDGSDHCQIPTDATCGLNGAACTACVGAQHCAPVTGQCEFISATGGGNGNGGNGGSTTTSGGGASGSTSSGTTTGGSSGTTGLGTTGSTSTGSATSTTGSTGGTTTGGTSGTTTGGTSGTTTGGTTGTCSATMNAAQQLPVDIYLMLDQSGSMSDVTGTGASKWDAVTSGIKSFVQQPSNAALSLGLQYFALQATGGSCPSLCDNTTDANNCYNFGGYCDGSTGYDGNCVGCTGTGDSCNSADYATPEVEIASLPGNASAISNSIAQHSPTSSTPTSAALQGAIDHAKSWAQAHPGHTVVDLLATDGDPTECDTNLSDIDAIAAAGLSGSPGIQTFVIGVGSSLSNLNSIAASGGTGQAYIIDTTGNVNQQMLQDMNQIRLSALGCAYGLPATATNPSLVNVQYAPSSGGPAVPFPNVSGSSACASSGNGWYYDNPTAPTKVVLCPSSCSTVGSDPGGEVDVLTGCPTTH